MKQPGKVMIETYGCTLNRADSEVMAGVLLQDGYELVSHEDDADVVIINSCTVKRRTFFHFRHRLQQLRAKKKLLVAGCIPQPYADTQLLHQVSYISTEMVGSIAQVIRRIMHGELVQELAGHPSRLCLPHVRANPVVEIIPIAQGCLGECSYCQTRLARGRVRSENPEAIQQRMELALAKGAQEIWLTAQDTGAYGIDLGTNLVELLQRLLSLSGTYFVRLGMANPNHVSSMLTDLIEIFKDPRVFKFLHLPLQSGSDRILRMMNRAYTAVEFVEICQRFRTAVPHITIATDVICGFPGESEEDFEASLAVLKQIHPGIINRSKFAAREFTPAADWQQLPWSTISERSRRLTLLVEQLCYQENQGWLGWEGEILLDEQKKPGSLLGRNFAYKPVVLMSQRQEAHQLGERIQVRITSAATYHLKGYPLVTT